MYFFQLLIVIVLDEMLETERNENWLIVCRRKNHLYDKTSTVNANVSINTQPQNRTILTIPILLDLSKMSNNCSTLTNVTNADNL